MDKVAAGDRTLVRMPPSRSVAAMIPQDRLGLPGSLARTFDSSRGRSRVARSSFTDGYSLLELERAGITEEQAVAAGLPIDRERTSALGSNVMELEKLRRCGADFRPA